MVQAVIFDFGDVLYKTPDRSWMRRWQSFLNLHSDPIVEALITNPEGTPFMDDLMTGKMKAEDLYEMLAKRWHVSPFIINTIRRGLMSSRRLNIELRDFLASLRPQYQTAILSNASSDARRSFTDVYHLDRCVDTMVISAEEGIAKPDARLYEICLERLGISAAQALFLDDKLENIEAARQLGMRAVQFHNNPQALAELRAELSC